MHTNIFHFNPYSYYVRDSFPHLHVSGSELRARSFGQCFILSSASHPVNVSPYWSPIESFNFQKPLEISFQHGLWRKLYANRYFCFVRKRRTSINRPPTPDVEEEDQDHQPTLQEIINIKVLALSTLWFFLQFYISFSLFCCLYLLMSLIYNLQKNI